MLVLIFFYKFFYRKSGIVLGILNVEKIILGRIKVNGDDVKNYYNDCKEFVDFFILGYVVNVVMYFFEMDMINL